MSDLPPSAERLLADVNGMETVMYGAKNTHMTVLVRDALLLIVAEVRDQECTREGAREAAGTMLRARLQADIDALEPLAIFRGSAALDHYKDLAASYDALLAAGSGDGKVTA